MLFKIFLISLSPHLQHIMIAFMVGSWYIWTSRPVTTIALSNMVGIVQSMEKLSTTKTQGKGKFFLCASARTFSFSFPCTLVVWILWSLDMNEFYTISFPIYNIWPCTGTSLLSSWVSSWHMADQGLLWLHNHTTQFLILNLLSIYQVYPIGSISQEKSD